MPRRRPAKESRNKAKTQSSERPNIDIKPVTENQADYYNCILDYDVTFCTGPAGSGKSYLAAGLAAKMILNKQFDHIIVTRPLICTGKDIGHLPGGVAEKIGPYIGPMQENLRIFLGHYYGLLVNDRTIRFEPLETMRGFTFNSTLMILDEAQNCTAEQIKMFVTRLGKNSKIIINGDVKQTDLKSRSGLEYIMNRVSGVEGIAICKLTHDDIQRNDVVARFLRAIEE